MKKIEFTNKGVDKAKVDTLMQSKMCIIYVFYKRNRSYNIRVARLIMRS